MSTEKLPVTSLGLGSCLQREALLKILLRSWKKDKRGENEKEPVNGSWR